MKTVSKLLNALAAIFILIGIYATIMYFVKIRPQNDEYQELRNKEISLNANIDRNNSYMRMLRDSITIKNAEINWRTEKIEELNADIIQIVKERDKEIEKLQDLSLEQILDIIIDYYGTDTTEISIETIDNEIRVVISPRIAREVSETIVKLESIEIELNLYKKQALFFDELSCEYIAKINLLEQADSLNQDNFNKSEEKNTILKDLLDNRDKKVKSITTQRNIVGGIAITVLILGLI